MPFQPNVNDELLIGNESFTVEPHPLSADVPYGQEGRQGTVYRLRSADEGTVWALKVFRPTFRFPALVHQAEKFAEFTDIPSLKVCERKVLTPQQHFSIISQHPELLYAVLMPWMDGFTWMDVLLDKRILTRDTVLLVSESLAIALSEMEQRGAAHGDISAANVILTGVNGEGEIRAGHDNSLIEFVDVEQMCGPGLDKPQLMPAGSPGYSRKTGGSTDWDVRMDRFAGGVMLAEMLAWCDHRIRDTAWGESYFDPGLMIEDAERSALLVDALTEHYGEAVAFLFQRVWSSTDNAQCPTFGEWVLMLKSLSIPQQQRAGQETGRAVNVDDKDHSPHRGVEEIQVIAPMEDSAAATAVHGDQSESRTEIAASEQKAVTENRVAEQIRQAVQAEQDGRWEAAIQQYERMLEHVPASTDIGSELVIALESAKEGLKQAREEDNLRQLQLRARRKKILQISISAAAVLIVAGSTLLAWAPWKQQASNETGINLILPNKPAQPYKEKEEPTLPVTKPKPSVQPTDRPSDKHVNPPVKKEPAKKPPASVEVNKPKPTDSRQETPTQSPPVKQPIKDRDTPPKNPPTSAPKPKQTPTPTSKPKPKPEPQSTPVPTKPPTKPNAPNKQPDKQKQAEQNKKRIKDLEESILQAFNVEDDTDKVIKLAKQLKKLDPNNSLANQMLNDLVGGQ